ncbi:MAG: hypothetical protein ACRD22_00510 [Terriglobia bacterium]
MTPMEMMGARILSGGDPNQPSAQEIALYQQQQRMVHIEMYRQATAQQCLVAMIVKSMAKEMEDGEPTPPRTLARRAKEAADALCVEFFGDDGQPS